MGADNEAEADVGELSLQPHPNSILVTTNVGFFLIRDER